MSTALSAPLSAPLFAPVDGSAARDAARRELERPEYHRDDPGLVSRVLEWIGDRLASLFSGGAGSNATLLLLVFVIAVIVVLALRAGRPVRRGRTGGGRTRPDGADLLAAADSREHRRTAARFEADQRLAEALREWLRAAVATIEERGVLAPRPGRTGAATAREAGPMLPTAAAELGRAMTAFEQVWFGGRPATTEDVARARAAADAVATARITRDAPIAPDFARW